MSKFLLDALDGVESKTTINKTGYSLVKVNPIQYVFSVIEDKVIKDQVSFTKQDLKALFILLNTNEDGCYKKTGQD